MTTAAKCVGLFNRDGIKGTDTYLTWPAAAFNANIGGMVCMVNWSDLQPTNAGGGTVGGYTFTTDGAAVGAGTPANRSVGALNLDHIFGEVDAYNNTAAVRGGTAPFWTIKLRLFLGEFAPTWALNLGSGPISYSVTGYSASTWVWFGSAALNAWKAMEAVLANYVPRYTVAATGLANTQTMNGHPLLGEVAETLAMTHYGEPLMKDDFGGTRDSPTNDGWKAALTAGFTQLGDQGNNNAAVDYMATVWTNTPWSMAYNPAIDLSLLSDGSTPATVSNVGTSKPYKNTPFTIALQDRLASSGPTAVLGNNSLDANQKNFAYPTSTIPYADRSTDYTVMYINMARHTIGAAFAAINSCPAANYPVQVRAAITLPIARPIGWTAATATPGYIQTAAFGNGIVNSIAGVTASLDYAVWLGARMIELPSPYWSPAPAGPGLVAPTGTANTGTLSVYHAQLVANDPTGVAVGPASKVAFTTQPTGAVTGVILTPAVQVAIQDVNGTTVTTATDTVVLSIGTNPGGSTLGGTTSVSAVNGVATFGSLSLNNVGTGYSLHAVQGSLTAADSTAFNITSGIGAPAALAIEQVPTGTMVGAVVSPAITVEIDDANGVQTASTATVTVAIGTNPGAGVLGGTLSLAAFGGLATFSDLTISGGGSGYTLTFTSSGLTPATSGPFTITAPTNPSGRTRHWRTFRKR